MLLVELNGHDYLKKFESVEELVKEVGLVLHDERLQYGATPEEMRGKLENLLVEDIELTIRRLLLARITKYPTMHAVDSHSI